MEVYFLQNKTIANLILRTGNFSISDGTTTYVYAFVHLPLVLQMLPHRPGYIGMGRLKPAFWYLQPKMDPSGLQMFL